MTPKIAEVRGLEEGQDASAVAVSRLDGYLSDEAFADEVRAGLEAFRSATNSPLSISKRISMRPSKIGHYIILDGRGGGAGARDLPRSYLRTNAAAPGARKAASDRQASGCQPDHHWRSAPSGGFREGDGPWRRCSRRSDGSRTRPAASRCAPATRIHARWASRRKSHISCRA